MLKPEVPEVTPAPDSPLLRTIVLSVIVVLVEAIEVKVPLTVKSPVTVTAPANDADSSAPKVRTVWSALSSIPVDAKLEIVPPSTESPDTESAVNVKVCPDKSIEVPEIEPPVIAALAVVIVENVPAADVVAPMIVPSTAPPLTSTVANVEVPVEVTSPVTSPVTLPVTAPVKSPVTSPVPAPV